MLDTSIYLDDDGTWKTGPNIPLRLGWPCATNIDDSTYFLGGGATQNGPIVIDMSAFVCSGDCSTWTSAGSIPGPDRFLVSCAKASLDDGRVVVAVAGGKDISLSSDVKMYDVSAGTWFSGPSLPAVRARGGMITLPASGR